MVPECIRSGNLFLWGTVICSLLVLARNQSDPRDPPIVRVKGESVSFVPNITEPCSKIKWFFDPQTKEGEKIMVAEISKGEPKRTNPGDQFGQRLEMVNWTNLTIVDLKTEDSGNYTADVYFDPANIKTDKFSLVVNDKSDVGSYTCLFFPYCRTSLAIIICLCAFVIFVHLYLRHRRAKMKGSNEGSLAWCPPLPDQKMKEKPP